MLAILLAPVYIAFCLYILRWGIRYMTACHHFFSRKSVRIIIYTTYAFLASSILIAFLLPHCQLQRFINLMGNYWLGTIMYILMIVMIVDVIRVFAKRTRFRGRDFLFSRKGFVCVGSLCIVAVIMFSALGIYGAKDIKTTEYNITVEKSGGNLDSLHIALVADLHLGYSIGTAQMKRMVDRINDMKPDIVLIAGDVFDNEYEALDDPEKLSKILSGIESRYGVFACYGNHDIEEKILAGFTFGNNEDKNSDPRMDDFLKSSDITLLQDEGIVIDDLFYLYGRPDKRKPGVNIIERKTPAEITAEIDKRMPVIVIDHEPAELQALSDADVDVDLCGHTHDGQMFPGNLTINLFWENACGYLRKGDMHNIVTSGIGVFGPAMRVGTRSEICDITVNFN